MMLPLRFFKLARYDFGQFLQPSFEGGLVQVRFQRRRIPVQAFFEFSRFVRQLPKPIRRRDRSFARLQESGTALSCCVVVCIRVRCGAMRWRMRQSVRPEFYRVPIRTLNIPCRRISAYISITMACRCGRSAASLCHDGGGNGHPFPSMCFPVRLVVVVAVGALSLLLLLLVRTGSDDDRCKAGSGLAIVA